jgi:Purple acid Phosphatase, N-terminal domain
MIAAGTTGLLTATAGGPPGGTARGRPDAKDGTPEQIHLTWGDDPTRSVVVSWASPGQAARPRVRIGQRVITAKERAFAAMPGGTVTWTYHARVDGLRPGATYGYAVTADNDANAADPFSATFSTAPEGRAAFRFTSFGDLARPGSSWSGPSGQAAYAVGAVETFQPLFHLLNGGVGGIDADRDNPGAEGAGTGTGAARAWQHVQASAANRPWLPVPGDHQHGPGPADQGLASYLTRYTLPSNGADGFQGRWYAFRVGTALFVCLSGDDVAYSAAGTAAALVPDARVPDARAADARAPGTRAPGTRAPGTRALGTRAADTRAPDTQAADTQAADTRTPDTQAADTRAADTQAADTRAPDTQAADTRTPGTRAPDTRAADTRAADTRAAESGDDGAPAAEALTTEARDLAVAAVGARSGRGYSGGAQTRWLESTLAAARADASIDWVIAAVHQCACRSAPDEGGSDLGIRREWLPIFDTYEVDLVLSGHANGYERSFPVRGFEAGTGRDAATGAVTDTRRPHPVTRVDGGVFDTSQGSVHLVVGGGGAQGASAPGPGAPAAGAPAADVPDADATGAARLAAVFTRPASLVPDPREPAGWARPAADAVEEATWSARHDASAGYGIAVFDLDPGTEAGGQTSITVHYYHAAGAETYGAYPGGGPADDYLLFDTFTLVRPRSDGRRWHPKG